MHDFVRETSLTTEEWMSVYIDSIFFFCVACCSLSVVFLFFFVGFCRSAIHFLTETGKICSDIRQGGGVFRLFVFPSS